MNGSRSTPPLGSLRTLSPAQRARQWTSAHELRIAHCGAPVHLRALIEISNRCRRTCHYCGLRGPNHGQHRFTLSREAIVAAASAAAEHGFGTVVLQAGEHPSVRTETIFDVITYIKGELGLAVTLSLGERLPRELERWRRAGADRYLLRFETSNRTLYDRLHPGHRDAQHRAALLRDLRDLGYEVGTGFLIGLPGSRWDDLERDVELTAALDPDMIGVGPFIPHPDTPLGATPPAEVPADVQTTHDVIARLRHLCPRSNIPATTALGVIGGERGRFDALLRGANVLMPNLTPASARSMYRIYPGKENAEAFSEMRRLVAQLQSYGLEAASGPGSSPRYLERTHS